MLWRVQVVHFSHWGHMLRLRRAGSRVVLVLLSYFPTAVPHTSVATEFWSRVRRP